ncbi:MAG: M23 family metallopeptidase [Bdellovibrionota bacterium]
MKKIILFLFVMISCTHNPYETATPERISTYKEVAVPFASGTSFHVSMSPYYMKNRHYSWDLEVPFGTPVHAIESGKVLSVFQPEGGGGCDQKLYLNKGHNVRVIHDDGTVAQYLHVDIKVKEEDIIQKGQVIALTANSGVVCRPNLHLMVFRGKSEIRPSGETIPLRFSGIPEGRLIHGYQGKAP